VLPSIPSLSDIENEMDRIFPKDSIHSIGGRLQFYPSVQISLAPPALDPDEIYPVLILGLTVVAVPDEPVLLPASRTTLRTWAVPVFLLIDIPLLVASIIG
jgi:hypothetical protein